MASVPRTRMLIGICPVRNEGDILLQALQHAAHHFDLLLVVDVCSWDDTPAVIEHAVQTIPNVAFVGRVDTPYLAEVIRPELYAAVAPHVPAGTWWGFADADEFVEGDVRQTIAEAERRGRDYVEGASAMFFYTADEAAVWRAGGESAADRARPIHERRTLYCMSEYSVRLFRQSRALWWPRGKSEPFGLVRPLPWRLNFRHYQYRDLDQLTVRWRTRREAQVSDAFKAIHYHWYYDSPEQFITTDTTGLRVWRPGEALVPDARLAPLWDPGLLERMRRTWRQYRVRTKPPLVPSLFADLDVPAILARSRRGGTLR
jgi:hypothetical protein